MQRSLLLSATLASLLAVGCVSTFHHGQRDQRRSSTIEFLYPKGKEMTLQPKVPHLRLPLSVGIAFVPDGDDRHSMGKLTAAEKLDLLEEVAARFKSQPIIENIELIPTAYLKPGGGFDNLDQIGTMLGIDVIALVAYDQILHTHEDWRSLAYWTVVGMVVVDGEKNDTSTMIDTTVFHIPSRKLLFRAPGTSKIRGYATPISYTEKVRRDAHAGMAEANQDMIANLDRELTRFKKRVKAEPKRYKVTHRPGYSGVGDLGFASGLLVCLLLLVAWRRTDSVTG